MSIRRSVPVVFLSVAGLAAGLTACGTDLAPEVHPGAAAVVGETTISIDEVDELALDLCSVERPVREQQGDPAPLGFFRGLAIENLAGYELARQYAEEHDLEPGPTFDRRLDLVAQQLRQRGAPTYAAEILVGFEERNSYRDAVLAATGDPQAAQQDFAEWAQDVDVSVDPRFGSVDLSSGDYSPPKGLSVRVTEIDPAAAGRLPAGQRCG